MPIYKKGMSDMDWDMGNCPRIGHVGSMQKTAWSQGSCPEVGWYIQSGLKDHACYEIECYDRMFWIFLWVYEVIIVCFLVYLYGLCYLHPTWARNKLFSPPSVPLLWEPSHWKDMFSCPFLHQSFSWTKLLSEIPPRSSWDPSYKPAWRIVHLELCRVGSSWGAEKWLVGNS